MRALVAVPVLALSSAAWADIIFGSTCPNTGGTPVTLGAGSASTYAAAGFTIPDRAMTLTAVRLWLDFTGQGQGEFSIWTGSPLPTAQIATLIPPPQTGAGEFLFSPAAPVALEPGQTYWVHVQPVSSPTGSFSWTPVNYSGSRGYATLAGYIDSGSPRPPLLVQVDGQFTDGCYANCDGSTTPPILNIADFTCFLQKYFAGDWYSKCDQSCTCGTAGCITYFTCFLTKFAAGCP